MSVPSVSKNVILVKLVISWLNRDPKWLGGVKISKTELLCWIYTIHIHYSVKKKIYSQLPRLPSVVGGSSITTLLLHLHLLHLPLEIFLQRLPRKCRQDIWMFSYLKFHPQLKFWPIYPGKTEVSTATEESTVANVVQWPDGQGGGGRGGGGQEHRLDQRFFQVFLTTDPESWYSTEHTNNLMPFSARSWVTCSEARHLFPRR